MRNSNRGRGVLAAAVVGVAAALAAAVPANAAPPAPPAANCILVVQGAPTADKTLPVKEVCGDAARAKAGAADFQPIVTLYEHAGWGGWSQTLYGGYGTCDHDGYNFEISDWWKVNLSSYRVHGACYWSRTECP